MCDRGELPSGERLLVEIADEVDVCLFNVAGDLFAVEGRCAHRGGPICNGDVSDDDATDRPFGPVVTCPWHGWRYDLASGDHLGPANACLRSYPVEVDEELVYLVVDGE